MKKIENTAGIISSIVLHIYVYYAPITHNLLGINIWTLYINDTQNRAQTTKWQLNPKKQNKPNN